MYVYVYVCQKIVVFHQKKKRRKTNKTNKQTNKTNKNKKLFWLLPSPNPEVAAPTAPDFCRRSESAAISAPSASAESTSTWFNWSYKTQTK